VRAFENGVLQQRSEEAIESLRSCKVCPRDCEIDRFNNKIGVCKSGRLARVASAFPHFGEESPDTYVNVMDQYYPGHKAETEPRFAEINRGINADEFCGVLELARAAGLWRFDTRWRHVIPYGAPVWLPRIQHDDPSRRREGFRL
jgi:uncharacterized Fe-S radical SAM superfamily protein PflX